MSSDNADNAQAVAVGDSAQEYTEKTRLRGLFKARNEAAKAVREAPLRKYDVLQEPSGFEALGEYAKAAVTAYVIECEPLFQSDIVQPSHYHGLSLQ